MEADVSTTITLSWEATARGDTLYTLVAIEPTGQLRLLGTFEQGPFDTALEVAQWAWKLLAKEVRPSLC